MSKISIITAAIVLSLAGTTLVHAQGAQSEWEDLLKQSVSFFDQGNNAQALSSAQRAIEVAQANVGLDHPNVAQSLNHLAQLYQAQGNYAQAEPLYKRSRAILVKALGIDHPNVAQSMNNLAVL
jgi:tetratricopeptide (TPR) repeat protein